MANIPGFPDAISGHELLDRQIAAVRKHEDRITYLTPARAVNARRTADGYEVDFEWLKQQLTGRGSAVLLTTGVVDRIPHVEGKIEPIFPWANQAIVMFCVLCDGHELPGKSVAVLGESPFAARLAVELLYFRPKSVEILTHGQSFLEGTSPEERGELEGELRRHGIGTYDAEIVGFDGIREKRFVVRFADGTTREYDRGFSGLGWYDMHTDLPRALGAALDEAGYVRTDEDGRVLAADGSGPIPGLYCAGDLRSGWNQIPEAWATAERAVIHFYSKTV